MRLGQGLGLGNMHPMTQQEQGQHCSGQAETKLKWVRKCMGQYIDVLNLGIGS